jgi:hypothetical protein
VITLGELGPLGILALYIACGAATFPLTIALIRGVVSVAAPARATPAFHQRLDRATAWSFGGWIILMLLLYYGAVLLEHRKPCDDQRTNQLTTFCKKKLGAIP